MLGSLSVRQRQPELLDEPDVDPRNLRKSLAFIRWINRLMGYDRLIVHHLERFSSAWQPGQTLRILDVGTGSADIPLAILRWASEKGFAVRVVGIDLHPQVIREAAGAAREEPRLTIVRGDALRLPFDADSFDYATTSMFLHHLDDADAARALAEMGRVARRGIIASDLLRLRRSYLFITLATLLANPMVRHDARVSVAQAFSAPEIQSIRDRAGVEFAAYFAHFTHRFVLAGEKRSK
jgi:ubiquinone/menaquinone biosynthesis C-methylase UbiE